MPTHYGKNPAVKNVNSSSMKPMKKKEKMPLQMPEPLFKPRKDLSKRQKDLMKTHKEHHTPAHLKEMRKLMKAGYCFEQAHELAQKMVGK